MIWIGGRADKENYKVLSCSSDTRGEHWRLSAEVGQAVDSYHGQDHPGEARCVAGRGSPPGRGRGQRIAHVRPRRVVPGEVGPEAKRKKTPRTRGLFGGQVVVGYFLASPNLPRSVLTNRDSFPFAVISRKIAE